MKRPERADYPPGRLGEMDYNDDNKKYIDQLLAERKELIADLNQTISNLEEKQKSFHGTNGEMARANYKLGLGWAIESFKTIVDSINN